VNEVVQVTTSEALLVENHRIQSEHRVLTSGDIEVELHLPARKEWRVRQMHFFWLHDRWAKEEFSR
jgi:hypothetical protein